MTPGWMWRLLLVGAVWLGACRDPEKVSGTALYVTTEFDPKLLITQVRVWGDVDGQPHFGPEVLPAESTRLLNSGETLRVLLGDVPNGVRADVSMEGLSGGTVVARGNNGAEVRDGYEVDVTLRLEPVDAPDGGTGEPGTFCAGCDGCCMQGQCAPSTFNTCGKGGIACTTCDPRLATACDGRGVCTCGVNPACSARTADRCILGSCRCGTGGACGTGQACVNGQCTCSPDSCSGCCAGNTCEEGTNNRDRCGRGGAACLKCPGKDATCSATGVCG